MEQCSSESKFKKLNLNRDLNPNPEYYGEIKIVSRIMIKRGKTLGMFPSVNENAGLSRVESGIEKKVI